MDIKRFNEYYKLNEFFQNSKYKYENIIIEINNVEEFDEIKEYIKEIIYPKLENDVQSNWNSIFHNLKNFIYNKPYYARIKNTNNSYKLSYGSIDFYHSGDFDFNHEKLFTIKDVRNDLLNNIFKFGISTLPTYKPRKIDKNI